MGEYWADLCYEFGGRCVNYTFDEHGEVVNNCDTCRLKREEAKEENSNASGE